MKFPVQKPLILVGTATCGRSAGALDVLEAIRDECSAQRIDGDVIEVGCIGLCYLEPLVSIIKPNCPGIYYGQISPEKVKKLIKSYLVDDDPLPSYALGTFGDGKIAGIPNLFDLPVLKPQVRRILRNCGFIDPANIDHYTTHNGYNALAKALKMEPAQIIEEINKSGLRGRGGAGFPTGLKWAACRDAKSERSERSQEKYVVCNADEGDPGAFMDRSLIESDPHAVLEGVIIAGYTIGAKKGYIYVRGEYPLAVQRLHTAIAQAREKGFLGQNILGKNFSFDLEIFQGAGAFVCGEETALMASIEGGRGMPRHRPPFPAQAGLWNKPTLINNVKTYCFVPWIIKQGAESFASIGTDKSKGTVVFALAGKVANCGLIEVPMGIKLREIIYGIGGGIPDGKAFKAVQTGGPSGGCLPAEFLDSPVDYESLTAAGSIMGSGGMVVMDEDICMVDIARYFLDFAQKESCGKCVPCRLGTKQMLDILKNITEGRGKTGDIELLAELGQAVKAASLCGLGQTAPNPVLTTMRYFRDEYAVHIEEKRCPAKRCKALISYRILPDKCQGCQLCFKACPVEAITGQPKGVHVITQSKCVKCGMCLESCPAKFGAVECVSRQLTGASKQ